MKNIKKLLLRTLTTILFFSINVAYISADGGTNPYSPYKPHNPVDTSLGGLEDIVLIGVVLYTVGLGLLAYSHIFKKKFLK